MRADAHYVEQLDSSVFSSPIRFIEVRSIESPGQDDELNPSAAFVDSIKRHGVLQPLLVRSRGGRHLVIAGRKRLAAAVAAGLQAVPCVVERVDDEQAPILAAATNTPSIENEAAAIPAPALPADVVFAAFADCLTAVVSSANLLSPGSTLTQSVAVDLVRAEAARALQLLLGARILKGDVSVVRRDVPVRTVIERALDQTASERRLRGVTLDVASGAANHLTVWADEDLLGASLSNVITGVMVLLESPRSKAMSLRISSQPNDMVALTAVHEGSELPLQWRSKFANPEWPVDSVQSGNPSAALVLLRAAHRVAELHGGHMTLDCSEGRTTISLIVPTGRG